MIHIIDMSGIQLILIEIGALLQVVAICAYLRGTSAFWRLTHPKEHGEHVQEQGLEFGNSDLPAPGQTHRTRDEDSHEDAHHEIKAGHLTSTSKVKFRQSFQFRRHGT
jgi:hypothetical protein